MLSTDKQTNKQTDKLTNATKNITSFAKEVITDCDGGTRHKKFELLHLRLPDYKPALFFEAYWLGTSSLGMIQTAVGHHYDFEFVL